MTRHEIEMKLMEMGANPFITGFDYVVDALMYIEENGGKVKIADIYKYIGDGNLVNCTAAERCIRYFLLNLRKNGNPFLVYHYIGVKGSNSASIFKMYKLMILENEVMCKAA